KLGNDVMAKLVAEHQLALTQNRRVQVTQPIKIQPLEVRYAG
ncbi:MAG: transcriptional regulator, partial [Lacticaseibacillus paracasei]|nr:transcriptional regulator [Lacticaseibacillus paracasei]